MSWWHSDVVLVWLKQDVTWECEGKTFSDTQRPDKGI